MLVSFPFCFVAEPHASPKNPRQSLSLPTPKSSLKSCQQTASVVQSAIRDSTSSRGEPVACSQSPKSIQSQSHSQVAPSRAAPHTGSGSMFAAHLATIFGTNVPKQAPRPLVKSAVKPGEVSSAMNGSLSRGTSSHMRDDISPHAQSSSVHEKSSEFSSVLRTEPSPMSSLASSTNVISSSSTSTNVSSSSIGDTQFVARHRAANPLPPLMRRPTTTTANACFPSTPPPASSSLGGRSVDTAPLTSSSSSPLSFLQSSIASSPLFASSPKTPHVRSSVCDVNSPGNGETKSSASRALDLSAASKPDFSAPTTTHIASTATVTKSTSSGAVATRSPHASCVDVSKNPSTESPSEVKGDTSAKCLPKSSSSVTAAANPVIQASSTSSSRSSSRHPPSSSTSHAPSIFKSLLDVVLSNPKTTHTSSRSSSRSHTRTASSRSHTRTASSRSHLRAASSSSSASLPLGKPESVASSSTSKPPTNACTPSVKIGPSGHAPQSLGKPSSAHLPTNAPKTSQNSVLDRRKPESKAARKPSEMQHTVLDRRKADSDVGFESHPFLVERAENFSKSGVALGVNAASKSEPRVTSNAPAVPENASATKQLHSNTSVVNSTLPNDTPRSASSKSSLSSVSHFDQGATVQAACQSVSATIGPPQAASYVIPSANPSTGPLLAHAHANFKSGDAPIVGSTKVASREAVASHARSFEGGSCALTEPQSSVSTASKNVEPLPSALVPVTVATKPALSKQANASLGFRHPNASSSSDTANSKPQNSAPQHQHAPNASDSAACAPQNSKLTTASGFTKKRKRDTSHVDPRFVSNLAAYLPNNNKKAKALASSSSSGVRPSSSGFSKPVPPSRKGASNFTRRSASAAAFTKPRDMMKRYVLFVFFYQRIISTRIFMSLQARALEACATEQERPFEFYSEKCVWCCVHEAARHDETVCVVCVSLFSVFLPLYYISL